MLYNSLYAYCPVASVTTMIPLGARPVQDGIAVLMLAQNNINGWLAGAECCQP